MAGYDYTKYSYDDLVVNITNKLRAKQGWSANYESATSRMLIELIAANVDQLHYMLERRTQDSYLSSAKLPSSVRALASQVGYLPRRKVSSKGELELRLINSSGVDVLPTGVNTVIIPKNTKIVYNDENFLTTEETFVNASTTYPVKIKVIEGLFKQLTFDPSDVNGTLFKHSYVGIIKYENIEENSLQVFTPSQVFSDVNKYIANKRPIESLEFAKANDKVFDVKIMHDHLRILFGDNKNGQKPTGTTTIQYIESDGADSSVLATGVNFSFETDLLKDNSSGQGNLFQYKMTNSGAIDGGVAAETLEEIKRNAPNFARTGNRAVTKFDYQYWVKLSGIAGIVDATCYSEQEVGYNVFNMNNVYISYLKSDGTGLSTSEKTEITTYMESYQAVTAHVIYVENNDIDLQISLTAKKHADIALSDSEFYDVLKNAMIQHFSYKDGSLGRSVYLSSLMKFLTEYTIVRQNTTRPVVDFVDLTIKALYKFKTPIVTQLQTIIIKRGATNDKYHFNINGVAYIYTQQALDTTDATLATSIQVYLDGGSNAGAGIVVPASIKVDAQVANAIITLKSEVAGQTFTITNTGSTTVANIYVTHAIQIPTSTTRTVPTKAYLKTGSVEIIKTDGTILHTDNGSGVIGTGTINYTTGILSINILPDDEYYVRYNFLSVNTFIASKKDVFNYSLPKAGFFDVNEKLSKIIIVK